MKPAKTVRLRVSFEYVQPARLVKRDRAFWRRLFIRPYRGFERLRVERVEKKRGKR